MWLITGGAGFIGSHVVNRLSQQGENSLAICDTLGHGHKWTYLRHARIDFYILPHQVSDFLQSSDISIEGILHLGAISDTCSTDGDAVIQNNIQLSQKLWDFCARCQIPFLYASSAATYGLGIQGFSDHPDRLHQLTPLNLYGWSKHMFDRWVDRQVRSERPTPSQWAGFKFFNVYGVHERHKGPQRSVVSSLYDRLAYDAYPDAPLFRSYRADVSHGEQKRDFIWVEDCVDVILWFMSHPKISGLFNVGTGRARSFNDLAYALFSALDRPAVLTYIDMPDGLDAQYQYYTEADMKRLLEAGYPKPFTSLEEGVTAYVQQRRLQDYSEI